MSLQHIGVIGAGAWGTALASVLARKGHQVKIWAYETETIEAINQTHVNAAFLPDIRLPDSLQATSDLLRVVKENRILIMATPSHVSRGIAQKMLPGITQDHELVILTKGIEQHSLTLMSEVYRQELHGLPLIAVLSGPNFAREVAQGLPTAAVLACEDLARGKVLQHTLNVAQFRVYLSQDLIGVQVGGTVKNVIAIAAGIADGMNLGLSARAALICRGLAEMERLGTAMGGKTETFLGMSGVGDLILTATGHLSRNYSLGVALGRGEPLEKYMADRKSVAEGVKNAVSVHELAHKFGVEMPNCATIHDILYAGLNCQDALKRLLERSLPATEYQ